MNVTHYQLLCRVITGIEFDKSTAVKDFLSQEYANDKDKNLKRENIREIQKPEYKNANLQNKALSGSVKSEDWVVDWYDCNMYDWNEVRN